MDIRLPKYKFEELAALVGVPVYIDTEMVAALAGVDPSEIETAIDEGSIKGICEGDWYGVFLRELLSCEGLQDFSDMMLKDGRLVPRPRFPLAYLEAYFEANNRWFDLEDAARLTGQRPDEVWADWFAHRIAAMPPLDYSNDHLDPEPDLIAADPKPNPGGSGWSVVYVNYVDEAGLRLLNARARGYAPTRKR